MPWLKSYGLRFVEDVAAFAEACLLSLLTALPIVVYGYSIFFFVAYIPMLLVGAMCIFVAAGVTAIVDSYRWKFLIYFVVLVGTTYLVTRNIFDVSPAGGGDRLVALLYVQVVFAMGIFYYLLQRRRIADHLAARRRAVIEPRETGS